MTTHWSAGWHTVADRSTWNLLQILCISKKRTIMPVFIWVVYSTAGGLDWLPCAFHKADCETSFYMSCLYHSWRAWLTYPVHFHKADCETSFYMSCLYHSWRAWLTSLCISIKLTVKQVSIWVVYFGGAWLTSLCSIGNHSLTPESEGAELQCLPLYSILLALGNPTVNYFRQAVSRLVTDYKGLTLFLQMRRCAFLYHCISSYKTYIASSVFFYHIQ